MSCLRDQQDMVDFTLGEAEILTISIDDWNVFKCAEPELSLLLLECTAAVNKQNMELGEPPSIALAL